MAIQEIRSMSQSHVHVYEIFIHTTPERLWQALTDGDDTIHYYFGARVTGITTVGSHYVYAGSSGTPFIEGTVVEANPPKRLVTTFRPHFVETDVETRLTWEIESDEDGNLCRLTLRHEDLPVGDEAFDNFGEGWARIVSELKTYLESPAIAG
jgi:uncharacterized protein YndB with AHSA1/START domain